MNREQIIETMARAADPLAFVEGSPLEDRGYALDEMRRALSALETAGLVVVPVEAGEMFVRNRELKGVTIHDVNPPETGN